MYYSVDHIIDDKVIIQNLDDGSIIEVNRNIISGNIVDGSIIKKVNDKYIIDKEYTNNRLKIIRDKLNRVKK